MWQILTAFATVVLFFTAYLGYVNKNHYEKEIEATTTAQSKLVSSEDYYFRELDAYNEAELIRKTMQAQYDEELHPQRLKADADNTQAEGDIATKRSELAKVQERLNLAKAALAELGDLDEQLAKLKRMKAEESRLVGEIAAKENEIASLGRQSEDNIKTIASYDALESDQRNKISPPSVNASVREVHASWGFIVLNGGVNQGIVPGSQLQVVRGEQVIAKLNAYSVEATTTSADIIPGSQAPDTAIRPGDKVVAVRNK